VKRLPDGKISATLQAYLKSEQSLHERLMQRRDKGDAESTERGVSTSEEVDLEK
jgi:hypothetical protein